jgi:hypothetical protein
MCPCVCAGGDSVLIRAFHTVDAHRKEVPPLHHSHTHSFFPFLSLSLTRRPAAVARRLDHCRVENKRHRFHPSGCRYRLTVTEGTRSIGQDSSAGELVFGAPCSFILACREKNNARPKNPREHVPTQRRRRHHPRRKKRRSGCRLASNVRGTRCERGACHRGPACGHFPVAPAPACACGRQKGRLFPAGWAYTTWGTPAS